MNRHLYRVLAGVMIGVSAVSMTACSGGEGQSNVGGISAPNNQEVVMGKYVEKAIELPKDMVSMVKCINNADGTMTVYGYNKSNKFSVYTSQDGEKWTESKTAWADKVGNQLIQDIIENQDGTVYLSFMGGNDGQGETRIKKAKADGTVEDIKLQDNIEIILQMEALPNGDIVVATYESVTRYSGVDGKRLVEYGGQYGFTVIGDKIAVLDGTGSSVVFYNLETGEEEEVLAYQGLDMGNKIISDEEGNVYLVNNLGINKWVKESETWETIVEASNNAFGDPVLMITAASIDKEGFNITFQEMSGKAQVFKYTYDPNMPNRATTELTLYMLEDDELVRKAIVEYQRQNPEVAINIQLGLGNDETGVVKEDAIRTLNTELLAGKGPDIILLDGLPIESYIEKGVLLDMNDIIAPMLDSKELLTNVVKRYYEEDKIYGVPTRFTVPLMWGDEALLKEASSVEELAQWAKANPDKEVLYSTSPQRLIEEFYGVSAMNWLDENGQIKAEEFKTFLEAINTLADKEAKSNLTPMEESDMNYYAREYMAYGDTMLATQDMQGFSWLNNYYSAITQRTNGDYKPLQVNGQGVFRGKGVIGINKNSRNLEVAKEIVKIALGEEVQKTELFENGFVVNTKAFENQKNEGIKGTVIAGQTTPEERPIKYLQAGKEEYEKMAQVLQSVTQPAYEDEILLEMIIEETKGYFDGTKTAEEATQAVAQRTKAYLSE